MIALENIGPIVYGAGAFNTQYHDPEIPNPSEVIRYAFRKGFKAIDTAAFYGPSEDIVGKALADIKDEFPRDSYFVFTKAGRWETDTFDYSAASIRKSVERSLSRLGVGYIDLLYIHDVEFQNDQQALEALTEATKLKNEGLIRYIGFSGYPVKYLVHTANLAREHGLQIDAVLSYANLTLQSTLLLNHVDELRQAGVKVVLNASPLSMSLLRSGRTHEFHPADEALRAAADRLAADFTARGIELADVATQFSFSRWNGPTVIGLRSEAEIDAVLANATTKPDEDLVKEAQTALAKFQNYNWPSGHYEGGFPDV